ncbi:MAG: FAD:protein FMN transferase [Daejeonella sp.]|uniref:FAD:protein FMN transferase n=1 Tax=Daejeonella sp. TaxID=2805397 RepID=UPI0027365ECE|nr:FAD:protein FMN transferase [Daejeonella sp.]MDP3469858.1 FAD:protein FMN transferase [Daejeonella sp.]
MIRFFLPIFIGVLLLSACQSKENKLITIDGEAQGTTWHISYLSEDGLNHKQAIDSILKDIDFSLSTYIPVSIISRINNNEPDIRVDPYFIDVFNKSMEISERTGGLFDVTVGPLLKAWGFGFSKKALIDSNQIDSILQYVDYKKLRLEGNKLVKEQNEVQLDFNAIAQGYSVDVLASFLEKKGIENYLVELGGELIAKGKKNTEYWKVGIEQPLQNTSSERKLEAIIELDNRALCTSGNYRKFYEEDGKKYAHILDPRTGFPARQNILSASVLADDAMTADAYATAFMVMGLEQSKQFLEENKDLNLEVFFIYDENNSWKTYTSESLKNRIKLVH